MTRAQIAALGVLLMVVSGATWASLAGTKRGWLMVSEVRFRLLIEPDAEDFVHLRCAEDGTCHAYLRSATFRPLSRGFARDDEHLFDHGTLVPGVNPSEFRVLLCEGWCEGCDDSRCLVQCQGPPHDHDGFCWEPVHERKAPRPGE